MQEENSKGWEEAGSCALNRGRAKGGTPKRLLDPNSGPLGGNPRLPYRKQEVEWDNLSAPRLNVDLPGGTFRGYIWGKEEYVMFPVQRIGAFLSIFEVFKCIYDIEIHTIKSRLEDLIQIGIVASVDDALPITVPVADLVITGPFGILLR